MVVYCRDACFRQRANVLTSLAILQYHSGRAALP